MRKGSRSAGNNNLPSVSCSFTKIYSRNQEQRRSAKPSWVLKNEFGQFWGAMLWLKVQNCAGEKTFELGPSERSDPATFPIAISPTSSTVTCNDHRQLVVLFFVSTCFEDLSAASILSSHTCICPRYLSSSAAQPILLGQYAEVNQALKQQSSPSAFGAAEWR